MIAVASSSSGGAGSGRIDVDDYFIIADVEPDLRDLVAETVRRAAADLEIAEPQLKFAVLDDWGAVTIGDTATIYIHPGLDGVTASAVALHECAHIWARRVAGPPAGEADWAEHEAAADRYETRIMSRLGYTRDGSSGRYVPISRRNGTTAY